MIFRGAPLLLLAAVAHAEQARIIDATVLDKAMPPEQIVSGLEPSLRALGACFTTADAGPADPPRGEVAFTIAGNGRATHVNASGELDQACVERESSRWRFPPPSGEPPQVFVTLVREQSVESAMPAQRERQELEEFCMLFQQYQQRTTDPKELPRKVLRTLLSGGMTTVGQRWANEMLSAPTAKQYAVFQEAARDRGLNVECPEYVGWYRRTFGTSPAGASAGDAGVRAH